MAQTLAIAIFVVLGLGFVLINLMVGFLVRPRLPHPEKLAIYECGEPAIGSSWVQFDLRFYIVALFYLVFDVEVALMYPWATVFRAMPTEALVLGLPFIGLVVVGFVYEWYSGSLDWVRSAVTTGIRGTAGLDLTRLARVDPETIEEQNVGAAAPAGDALAGPMAR